MDESKVTYSVLKSIYFLTYLSGVCSYSVPLLLHVSLVIGQGTDVVNAALPGTRGVSVMFNTSSADKSIGCLVIQSFQKAKPHFPLSKERKALRCLCIGSQGCPIKTQAAAKVLSL